MKINYKVKWATLSGEAKQAFWQLINVTGQFTDVPKRSLPDGHQKIAGLQYAYWSGYTGICPVDLGTTGVGEVILTRIDGSLSKAYAYPVGISGEALLFGSEFKWFSGHHSPLSASSSVENLFGNVPWPPPSGSSGGSRAQP